MKEMYERRKTAPMWYYNFSEKHARSVQVLVDSGQEHIDETINFLRGLSLELLLKAIICVNTNSVPPQGHNLKVLSEKAGLELAKEQLDLCVLFTHFINYAGRYPTPLRIEAANEFHATFEATQYCKKRFGKITVLSPNGDSKSYLNQENYKALYNHLLKVFSEAWENR